MQLALILGIAGALAAGFAGNEMAHGGMAEAMGLGHRHMMDYDGAHCAAMDGAMGAQHLQHMHRGDPSASHMGCGARHHQMDHPMMNGTMGMGGPA